LFEKILVGVDGSVYSHAALENAIKLAKVFKSKLLIVNVYTAPPVSKGDTKEYPPPLYISPETLEGVKTALKKDQEFAMSAGVASAEVKFILTADNPGAAIIKEAKASGISLIIVGSRGLTGIKRVLLGSVASYVAEYAHCDVHIVRR
jgi:nucleotide-binding universal stress UspA family protein